MMAFTRVESASLQPRVNGRTQFLALLPLFRLLYVGRFFSHKGFLGGNVRSSVAEPRLVRAPFYVSVFFQSESFLCAPTVPISRPKPWDRLRVGFFVFFLISPFGRNLTHLLDLASFEERECFILRKRSPPSSRSLSLLSPQQKKQNQPPFPAAKK